QWSNINALRIPVGWGNYEGIRQRLGLADNAYTRSLKNINCSPKQQSNCAKNNQIYFAFLIIKSNKNHKYNYE
ncbi:hypothetical protein ACFODT_11710, partial [Vibrio zhugei]